MPAGADLPGTSLLEVASGGKALRREAVFGEIFQHTAVAVGKPGLSLTHRWVREGRWKLIRSDSPAQASELYDLASDPGAERNVAGAHPERVRRLLRRIDAWWDEGRPVVIN